MEPKTFYRAWINAPSTLQSATRYHGMLGFRGEDYTENTCIFYPISGIVISMVVEKLLVSPGWPEHLTE